MTSPAPINLSEFSFDGQHLKNFVPWFLEKVKNADAVVALARAAPRLLQFYSESVRLNCPLICERALSFVEPANLKGKRVVLFDDTINYGSTMAETRRRLLSLGAKVECIALAVDRETFLGEVIDGVQHKPSRYLEELNPDYLVKSRTAELDVLHGLEIELFRTMAKPYMFDFPIFEVPLRQNARACLPSYFALRLGETATDKFIWPSVDPSLRHIRHFAIPIASTLPVATVPRSKRQRRMAAVFKGKVVFRLQAADLAYGAAGSAQFDAQQSDRH